MALLIEGQMFSGVLDTGVDVLVIADKHWPSNWPTAPASTKLQGIGQAQRPVQSSKILQWMDPDGQKGSFCPYVPPGLPVKLLGERCFITTKSYDF